MLPKVRDLYVIHLPVVSLVKVNCLLRASKHLTQYHLLDERIRVEGFRRVQDSLDLPRIQENEDLVACCVNEEGCAIAVRISTEECQNSALVWERKLTLHIQTLSSESL